MCQGLCTHSSHCPHSHSVEGILSSRLYYPHVGGELTEVQGCPVYLSEIRREIHREGLEGGL